MDRPDPHDGDQQGVRGRQLAGRRGKDHKGPIEKDRRLLFGAGQAIMGGLISDISSKKSAVADEHGDLASLVKATVPGISLATEADAISRSLSVDSNRTLLLKWINSSPDPALRALQDHIAVTFNGDVNAARG